MSPSLQRILQLYWPAFGRTNALPGFVHRAAYLLAHCRTMLGGHVKFTYLDRRDRQAPLRIKKLPRQRLIESCWRKPNCSLKLSETTVSTVGGAKSIGWVLSFTSVVVFGYGGYRQRSDPLAP